MLRILFIFLLMLAVFPAASVLAQDPPPPPPPASIFIQPIREAPGTPVTVQGSNFAPNTSVSITYGNTTVATVSTGNGSWTQSFVVPESPLGSHTVKAGTVSATFTVTSSVFVSISQGKVGSQATVRGDGFSANQGGITVAFDGEEVGTASADSLGSFTTTFVVPPRPRGTYQVQIGSSSIQNFTVISSLTLSPFTGPPGTTVDLIGSGFNADSNLSITFEGEIGRTISVDSQGSITTTFQIPVAAGGPRMIGVYHPSRGRHTDAFAGPPQYRSRGFPHRDRIGFCSKRKGNHRHDRSNTGGHPDLGGHQRLLDHLPDRPLPPFRFTFGACLGFTDSRG